MKFRRSLRGYDPQEVMSMIAYKIQRIDDITAENHQLKDKLQEYNHLVKFAEKIRIEDIRRIFGLRNAKF